MLQVRAIDMCIYIYMSVYIYIDMEIYLYIKKYSKCTCIYKYLKKYFEISSHQPKTSWKKKQKPHICVPRYPSQFNFNGKSFTEMTRCSTCFLDNWRCSCHHLRPQRCLPIGSIRTLMEMADREKAPERSLKKNNCYKVQCPLLC